MAANALVRSSRNRMFGGVCGGIAEWLGWDPTLVRVGYVLFSFLSAAFPGILVYLILWMVMPKETLKRPRPCGHGRSHRDESDQSRR